MAALIRLIGRVREDVSFGSLDRQFAESPIA
jgi:hypothetical protein